MGTGTSDSRDPFDTVVVREVFADTQDAEAVERLLSQLPADIADVARQLPNSARGTHGLCHDEKQQRAYFLRHQDHGDLMCIIFDRVSASDAGRLYEEIQLEWPLSRQGFLQAYAKVTGHAVERIRMQ